MKEMNGKISPEVFDSIHSVYPKLILKTYDQLMASANPVGNFSQEAWRCRCYSIMYLPFSQ